MCRSLRYKYHIIVCFLFLAHQAGFSQLNVPITVKNINRTDIVNMPVTFGVPLMKGDYQTTDNLMITDANGTAVPAQIDVLNRHWATDNSITHVLVHLMADVPANGSVQYHLKEGSSFGSYGLGIRESSDQIVVNTGVLKVYLNKHNFNLFDRVYLDVNGDGDFTPEEEMLTSDPDNGGILTLQDGTLQKSSDVGLFDPTVEVVIEEQGPVRAVIRFETYTRYISTNQHVHGFQARMYFYANSELVRVDYTIKNSDHIIAERHPLYFDDFSLISRLGFNPTAVRIGTDGGTFESAPGDGRYLYQSFHDQFTIHDGSDNVLESGSQGQGWIDVSDERHGVTAIVRDFWQTWPGALEINGKNELRIGLWPRFGQDWWWDQYGNGKNWTTTGLYWLGDMQEATKEVWYVFHGGTLSASTINSITGAINTPPVGVVPLTWYKETGVTLDLGGSIPIDDPLPANTTFDDYLLANGRSEDWDGQYMYGWFNYAGNVDRRRPCNVGSWPYSGAHFLMTGDPLFFYAERAKVLGELNGRPQWLSGYHHDRDASVAPLDLRGCDESWRENEDVTYIPGTGFKYWRPRDGAHLWIYDIETQYYYSGNKRIRDWYLFMGEALQVALVDRPKKGLIPHRQHRAMGHMLSALVQAYRVTGEPGFLRAAAEAVHFLHEMQDPYTGIIYADGQGNEAVSGAQIGFLARALVNFLEEIGNAHPQAEVDAFGVLQGIMEWNLYLNKFSHDWPGEDLQPSGTSVTLADPQAWFYLKTGIKAYKNQLLAYLPYSYGNMYEWGWKTNRKPSQDDPWVGRLTQYLLKYPKADTIPPSRITDLHAEPAESGIRLTWFAPVGVKKYHIRWSDKPISPTFTQNVDSCNFWKAEGIGNNLIPTVHRSEEFLVTDLPNGKAIYFAIVSFDENGNMSQVSNVVNANTGNVSSNTGPKPFPENFRLYPNHPNPFSRSTEIGYEVVYPGEISLVIYNVLGQEIRTYKRRYRQPQRGHIEWDGKDDRGMAASSGVYFVVLNYNGQAETQTRILLQR